jgi:L-rhamnose mutarotase
VERVCFLGRVRPDRLAEYRRRHADVWPEMLDALRAAGWSNYSLFLTDDGLVWATWKPATTQRRWRGWRIPT